jgi:hypothetical protein
VQTVDLCWSTNTDLLHPPPRSMSEERCSRPCQSMTYLWVRAAASRLRWLPMVAQQVVSLTFVSEGHRRCCFVHGHGCSCQCRSPVGAGDQSARFAVYLTAPVHSGLVVLPLYFLASGHAVVQTTDGPSAVFSLNFADRLVFGSNGSGAFLPEFP